MGYETSDWENVVVEDCLSCATGDHECAQEETGRVCPCEPCTEERNEREAATSAAEFFNGLEDFFKSIDPDRVGWETIEAEADGPAPVADEFDASFPGDVGDLNG